MYCNIDIYYTYNIDIYKFIYIVYIIYDNYLFTLFYFIYNKSLYYIIYILYIINEISNIYSSNSKKFIILHNIKRNINMFYDF